MAKLGELGKIITGNTPKTSDAQNYESNDICFVKPSDFTDNEITEIHQSEFYISAYAKDKARVLPTDSILVTCIGIIGKVAINKVPCAFNQQINAIVPEKKVCNPRYIAYAIQNLQPKMQSTANAAVVPILNKTQFSNLEVPLLPVGEQKQIACNLNKIDKLIFLRKQQLAKLDELVKAQFVEMFGDPVLNTKSLLVLTGRDFFKLSNGKAVPDEKRFEMGIPAYGGNGVSWYTDDALLNNDTLVVGRVGFQSGNVHFAKGPHWVTDNAMYISWYDSKKYNLTFLHELMQQIDFSRYQDAGDLKKITQKPFMNFEYIQPPMCQQNEFATFVACVDQQKQTVQQSLEKLELMKKALMQEYFG